MLRAQIFFTSKIPNSTTTGLPALVIALLSRSWKMLTLGIQAGRQTAICVLLPLHDRSASKLQVDNDGKSGDREEGKAILKYI